MTTRETPETPPATPVSGRERGFSLLVALLVMALLTTLGLTLMFTSETERAISRNFSGTIQAGYAAEAVVDATIQALLFDLKNDSGSPSGWANKYLVVCDTADAATCLSRYGFNPTLAPCYDSGTPANGCVYPDTGGALTGSSGNWVADLTWRPSGTRPAFPSLVPVRLHPDLKAVLPWWKKFDTPIDWKNPTDPDALNTGAAGIAIASNCIRNCTTTPEFASDVLFVTGIGQSASPLRARITKSKNPATRSVSVRVKGDLLSVWGNALVGGAGPDPADQDKVIEGDYLVRGSTLQFNESATRVVMSFTAPNTGIVNNYYDTDSVPAIAGWWWKDARPCSPTVGGCDSNNTNNNGTNSDSDNDSSTQTLEPIYHHLPDPPDMDKGDTLPGGYRSDAPYSADYPGPEGLDARVRLRAGIIEIGDAAAGLGRVETLEGLLANPGHYWDNLRDVLTNDNPIQSPTEITGANKDELYRQTGTTWDINTKTGAFDIDPEQIKFPSLTDQYLEPLTRELYTTYYDFMRPATPSDTHPGGWALNLSGIDGSTGVGRDIDAAGLAGGDCWPRGSTPDISPSWTDLDLFDGTRVGNCPYEFDATLPGVTDCGTAAIGACPTSCTVELRKQTSPAPPAFCNPYPASFTFQIYTRKTGTFTADATLNLDTSSSIDSPRGRAQSTMFDSFAYKLYVDVLGDLDNCTPPQSTIYQNNMVNLPDVFKSTIPSVYHGKNSTTVTTCTRNDGPCFQERSAYMDVHIQLTDAPVWGGPPSAPVLQYGGGGRWFSVRYRAPGDPNGVMSILSDPRAGNGCTNVGSSDFHFETEFIEPATSQRMKPPGTLSTLAALVPKYDRALPMHGNDTLYRNMPTGAFVVALHLPCTDDLTATNKNPYKCSESTTAGYTAPTPSYPGHFTHLIGWAPKYSCWRTLPKTWVNADAAPPTDAPAAGCLSGTCGDAGTSWFAQSLWQANTTTLWNSPANFGKGTPDTESPLLPFAYQPTLGGFKLMISIDTDAPQTGDAGPCSIGLDRRYTPTVGCATGKYINCGVDNDGVACNGNISPASGCPGPHACDPGDHCQDEPDYVKGGSAYGGCTEIFSPLVAQRIPQLDPATGTMWDRNTTANRNTTPCTFYHGVDPDLISGWSPTVPAVNRYVRGWPGWSSAAYLEGAGVVFTNDTVRLGAPKKDCNNPDSCPPPDNLVNSASYNSGTPHNAAGTAAEGFFSDPIVFDGRMILYAGTETPATTSKIYIHDNLVPRSKFGCSDFLSLLSNGDTEIDLQMPFPGSVTDRHHMIALYSLSQGMLKVTTADSLDVSTELVGSWIANGANFGSHSVSGKPVQIIGTPTISTTDQCDHTYLPGRAPIPQRQYLSYVEDGTLPSSF